MLTKSATVLSLFSTDRRELGAADIARLLRRPRSTVYRLLGDMVGVGYLDYDERAGRYRVGIRLAVLGELARTATSLQRMAHQALLDVSATTGEMSSLMVVSGDEGVTIDVVESLHPLKIPGHLGGRFPLHATAGGKVFLAHFAGERLDAVLARPLPPFTAATITETTALRRQLDRVRSMGYARAEGEWHEGLCAVAAPVFDHRGAVIATVGAASVTNRWKPVHVRALTDGVVGAAARVSRSQGFASAARLLRGR